MPCAIIITSLPVEYFAVRSHLNNIRDVISSYGTIYEMGQFTGIERTWDIGLVEIGSGDIAGSLEVDRSIHFFQPQVVLFVGIAGGLKDVMLGDVVVATKIYNYEAGKAEEIFRPRPEIVLTDYIMTQQAKAEARNQNWLKRLTFIENQIPQVFISPIAAGEKVISSRKSEVYQLLRTNYGDAIAVEMVGFKFLGAAQASPEVSALVIRGISDLIGAKIEGSGFQELASRHASAFSFELLANLNLGSNRWRTENVVMTDPDEDEGIDRPFDPAKIRIESKNITIDLLLKRIRHGELNLSPAFQRVAGIWKPDVQSRLIESLLIRIPLPAFYLDATNDEQWDVVDGLQRLTTLKSFVLNKEMKLEGKDSGLGLTEIENGLMC